MEASDTDINSNLSYSKSNIRCFKGDIEDQVNCVDPFTMENDFINQVGNVFTLLAAIFAKMYVKNDVAEKMFVI